VVLLVYALERELEVSRMVAILDCSAGLGVVDTCSGESLCFSHAHWVFYHHHSL
jgi:hypothetical protein